jgi:hypothetical protein
MDTCCLFCNSLEALGSGLDFVIVRLGFECVGWSVKTLWFRYS